MEPGEVIYDEKRQKQTIRLIINELFKWLQETLEKKGFDILQLLVHINSFLLFLFKYALFYKNNFFREEKEWRLCLPASPNSDVKKIFMQNHYSFSDFSYFLREGRLVSYVDLNFEKNPTIIKRIVVGPKNNSNMIKEFINKNGIYCDITKSKGTYR